MVTSRVPAAVAALLDILRAAPSLADVRIVDGPPAVNLTERDLLYVGWQPNGESAVQLTQDFNAAGARTRDEAFVIAGYVESRGGDKEMSIRRDRVFEILGTVETELRATNTATTAPTLNGTVLWSHLTAGDLHQEQKEGSLAGLNFSVTCRARI
ncbi:hypothetical protein OG462_09085 [Streptomyces sp. NBC_01077]|uniref:hypothetical protein n=1 Tax=Streptomyces sp. NBC_01077 TaxID=2903746 RepID=UPI00386942B4|nr:hypothetical protein OG462_09085 [Streptomyces sp. NBC_01077]